MRADPSLALVTGASSGIGAAVAARLHAAGYFVVGAALDYPAGADASDVSNDRRRDLHVDVRDVASVERLFAAVDALALPLTVLVNCAGVGLHRTLEQTEPAEFAELLAVNLLGTFHTCRAAIARMRAGGRIFNLGSLADHLILPNSGAYAASKFGVRALSNTLAEELKHRQIRVTLVSPGAVATPLWGPEPAFAPHDMLAPGDVADVIVRLADLPLHVRVDEVKVAPERGVL